MNKYKITITQIHSHNWDKPKYQVDIDKDYGRLKRTYSWTVQGGIWAAKRRIKKHRRLYEFKPRVIKVIES